MDPEELKKQYAALAAQLSPAEYQAHVAALQAEADARAQQASQYTALKNAQRVQTAASQPTKTLVDINVREGMAKNPPSPFAQAIVPGQKLVTPDTADLADIKARGVATGAFTPAGREGADLPRDLEGVRAARDARGLKTIEQVAGDQRLLTDEAGNALATRDEYPDLVTHWNTDRSNGGASILGKFLNVIGAPARVTTTAINMGSDAIRGRKTPEIGDVPGLLDEALLNKKGHTVAEGGPVTSRGSGFGDLLRARAQMLLEQNPNATVADLLATPEIGRTGAARISDALTKLVSGSAFPEENPVGPETKLSSWDKNDPNFDFIGDAIGIVDDPVNFIPVGDIAGIGAKAAGRALRPAAKLLPTAVVDAARAAGEGIARAGSILKKSGDERAIVSGLRDAGESAKNADVIASKMTEYKEIGGAETAIQKSDFIDRERAAKSKMEIGDRPTVEALVQGSDGLPIVDVAHPAEQVSRLADVAEKHWNALTTKEQSLFAPVIAAKRAGKTADEVLAAAPDLLRLSTHEIAQKFKSLDPDIVKKMMRDHPWQHLAGDEVKARQLEAARARVHENSIERQAAQRVGLLGRGLTQNAGHLASPPRSAEAVKLLKVGVPEEGVRFLERHFDAFGDRPGYDPFKRRTMALNKDADIVRRAAQSLVDSGATKGNKNLALVEEYARNPAIQSDRAITDQVRTAVEAAWGRPLPRTTGTLSERQALVGARNTRVKGFVGDMHDAAAISRQAAEARIAKAKLGQRVASIVDAQHRPIVQSLDDALLRPRDRAPDAGILRRRYRADKNGVLQRLEGQFFQMTPVGNGGTVAKLPDDIKNYLGQAHLKYIDPSDPLFTEMPAFKHKVIPEAIHADLMKISQRMHPGAFERYASVAGRVKNAWAPIILNTPGFHTRNAFFGMFQTFLANKAAAVADPSLWKLAGAIGDAAEHNRALEGVIHWGGHDWKLADLVDEARRYGIVEGGRYADLERNAAQKFFYKDEKGARVMSRLSPISDRGLVTDEPLFKATVARGAGKLMTGKGITAENAQRLFTYLNHRLNEHATAAEAMNVVAKFHFDYTGSRLSGVEKTLRKIFPFYSWVKQSTVLTVEQMLKNPGKYAAVNHLYQAFSAAGEDRNVDPRMRPKFLGETGAVHVPGVADDDEKQNWAAMERPGTQLSWMGSSIPEAIAGLGSQLGPVEKAALERVTGKSAFGDKPVDRNYDPVRASPLEYLFGMREQNIPGYVARSVGGLPGMVTNDVLLPQFAPEYANQSAKMSGVDSDRRLLAKAISTILGPRWSVTSPVAVADQARAQSKASLDLEKGATQERKTRLLRPKPLDEAFRRSR